MLTAYVTLHARFDSDFAKVQGVGEHICECNSLALLHLPAIHMSTSHAVGSGMLCRTMSVVYLIDSAIGQQCYTTAGPGTISISKKHVTLTRGAHGISGATDSNANVGALECGRVVDAVAGHAYAVARLAQRLHDEVLVLRPHLRAHEGGLCARGHSRSGSIP